MKRVLLIGLIGVSVACGSSGSKATDATKPIHGNVAPATTVAATTAIEAAVTTEPSTTSIILGTTTAVAPTTSLPSTTTLDPLVVAQGQYLGISAEYEAVWSVAYSPYPNTVPWSKLPEVCEQLAPAVEKFAADIDAVTWPTDAQDEADTLVGASVAFAGDLKTCSHVEGTATALASITTAMDETGAAAGKAMSAMRVALSLPIDLD